MYTWILLTPGNTKTVNLELKSFCLLKTLERPKEEYMLKVVKLYTAKPVRDITQTWHFQHCSGTNHGTGKFIFKTICRCFSESFTMLRNVTHVPQHNTLRKGSRVIHCDGIDNRVSMAGRRTCGATGPILNGAPPTVTWPSSPWWTWRLWSWSHKNCWTRWSTRH